jgi:hypothetical protein
MIVSFDAYLRWLLPIALLAASACSSGGTAAAVPTPIPTVALSGVTITCGTTTVFGPASLSVASYSSGAPSALTTSCAEGSQVAVTFTSAVSQSTLGSQAALVFDILPSASTLATAVAATDATGFTANLAVSALPFTTPTLGAGTYLYVYLTALQPQGD